MHANNDPAPAGQAGTALGDTPLFDWRAYLPVHPAADLFPLMAEAELKELAEDIEKNGVSTRVVLWPDTSGKKWLLDGRNRLDALALLGLLTIEKGSLALKARPHDHPFEFECAHQHSDPYALALSLNVHRRHLNSEQKRDLIAEVLKAKPEASNLSIAKQVKADDKTVASVRRDLESNSEIPNKPRVEANGRKARGRKPGASPGFDTALRTRAKRLGYRISRIHGEPGDRYRLIGPDGLCGPRCFGVAGLQLQLDILEGKTGTAPAMASDAEQVDRDRKACVALYKKAQDAERELAQHQAAVSAKDIALGEFDGHLLRLIQQIKGAKPQRFMKTAVAARDLCDLAVFLTEIAALKKLPMPYRQDESRLIPTGNGVSADASADQMKAAHAALEQPPTSETTA